MIMIVWNGRVANKLKSDGLMSWIAIAVDAEYHLPVNLWVLLEYFPILLVKIIYQNQSALTKKPKWFQSCKPRSAHAAGLIYRSTDQFQYLWFVNNWFELKMK